MEIISHSFNHGLMVTSFVFVMMMLIDYMNVLTAGRLTGVIKGGRFRQYVIASFLGVIPGCLGAFMVVSFYVRGLVSFGALAAAMLATSGDASFVMFGLFPKKALIIHGLLFVVGVCGAFIVDKMMKKFKWRDPCDCGACAIHVEDHQYSLGIKEIFTVLKRLSFSRFLLIALFVFFLYTFITGALGPQEWGWERWSFVSLMSIALFIVGTVSEHYLHEHIWEHIVKKHLWRILLWSFFAFLLIETGSTFFNLEVFVKNHLVYVLLIAALVGIIPDSGPHLIFVIMFFKGIIPFSVLFTSCIVQDGHGIIPLLSHSVKASIWVKLFNLAIGLVIGYGLYLMGL
ncbi:MAG: putative manganese transporter [Candidatus Omnitrophica bacterium]|nr:putative manganese transporter [Candidatus Omnitrophota bacterium]